LRSTLRISCFYTKLGAKTTTTGGRADVESHHDTWHCSVDLLPSTPSRPEASMCNRSSSMCCIIQGDISLCAAHTLACCWRHEERLCLWLRCPRGAPYSGGERPTRQLQQQQQLAARGPSGSGGHSQRSHTAIRLRPRSTVKGITEAQMRASSTGTRESQNMILQTPQFIPAYARIN